MSSDILKIVTKDQSSQFCCENNSLLFVGRYPGVGCESETDFYLVNSSGAELKLSEFSTRSGDPEEVLQALSDSLGLNSQEIESYEVSSEYVKVTFISGRSSYYCVLPLDSQEVPQEVVDKIKEFVDRSRRWVVI